MTARMTADPDISIVIPARNEERLLPRCLDSIDRAARRVSKGVEVVVVLNRCTDATEAIALRRGCVIARDEGKNLARTRNTGARAARGSILVTIDADSVMSENMLEEVCSALARSEVVGGGVAT